MVIIPKKPPSELKAIDTLFSRYEYIKRAGFTYLAWNWIKPLAKFLDGKICLEVMAGSGALSYALKNQGAHIITTDSMEWHEYECEYSYWKSNLYTYMEKLDALEAIEKYGKQIDILIMSWPYMDNTAYQVIKKLNEVNSNALVLYIGEDYYGCTADDEFFDYFKVIENDAI